MNNRPRLLLAEDEPAAIAALTKFFRENGYDVDCASELEEAEALITVNEYDVVIADLRLNWGPALDGLEILRFIRRNSRRTPVIILSAHASPDVRRSADILGAEAFIAKPAPLPSIAEAVQRVLRRTA